MRSAEHVRVVRFVIFDHQCAATIQRHLSAIGAFFGVPRKAFDTASLHQATSPAHLVANHLTSAVVLWSGTTDQSIMEGFSATYCKAYQIAKLVPA